MKSKANRRLTIKHSRIGWCFIIPMLFCLILSKLYPMLHAFWLSFQSGVGMNLTFSGFENYRRMLQDKTFQQSMFNTFIYLAVQLPIMLALALLTAKLLNEKKLKFKGFFRTAVFLPSVTAVVSYSLVFRSLFAVNGSVNQWLMSLHIIDNEINWFGDPWLARFVIILALIWRWTGYNSIFYLSGMQSIDPEIYEAAKIDGASGRKAFWKITVPLLRPIILLTAISTTNGTLQLFAEPRNITNGGPANATLAISNYIYSVSFDYVPKFGYSAAMSYIVFIIVAVLAIIQIKVGDKRE